MRITLDQHELYSDAERARLARWFGDSAIGPVFFERPNRPIAISAEERDLWLAQANRIVERHVVQQRWVGFEAIAIGLVLMAAFEVARAMLGDVAPALRTIPSFYAAASGLVWPLLHERLYRRRLGALRREISDRLHMRSPMDPNWVLQGKRYNLFMGAAALIGFGAIGWGAVMAIRGKPELGAVPLLALVPAAWLFHFLGRRVDQVQRDRR